MEGLHQLWYPPQLVCIQSFQPMEDLAADLLEDCGVGDLQVLKHPVIGQLD